MKTTKTKFIVFALLLIFALVITACQAEQAATPAMADTAAKEPANTPVAAQSSTDEEPTEAPSEAMPMAYATLTDADGVPLLATSADVSDDELDYIINLETGVTFADGTLMDADAVIVNFNRWFDPKSEYRGDGDYVAWTQLFDGFKGDQDADEKPLSSFDGIEKVDDFTVLIHLNRPVKEMLVGLSDPAFAILSPEGLAKGEEIGVVR